MSNTYNMTMAERAMELDGAGQRKMAPTEGLDPVVLPDAFEWLRVPFAGSDASISHTRLAHQDNWVIQVSLKPLDYVGMSARPLPATRGGDHLKRTIDQEAISCWSYYYSPDDWPKDRTMQVCKIEASCARVGHGTVSENPIWLGRAPSHRPYIILAESPVHADIMWRSFDRSTVHPPRKRTMLFRPRTPDPNADSEFAVRVNRQLDNACNELGPRALHRARFEMAQIMRTFEGLEIADMLNSPNYDVASQGAATGNVYSSSAQTLGYGAGSVAAQQMPTTAQGWIGSGPATP